jgi:hypothetical protein
MRTVAARPVADRGSPSQWHTGCDSFQSLTGHRRCVRFLQIVELAPHVRPTGDFLDAAILFIELIESGVGIGLQRAPKLRRCRSGCSPLRSGE